MADIKMKKYDPEDLEYLLMHKQFHELYAEEKEFVLQHIEGEEEYNELRSTLFMLYDHTRQSDMIEPDPSIRANLLKEFGTEHKSGFKVWLNSVYVQDRPWHKQTLVRIALAACLAGLAIVFFVPKSEQNDFASQQENNESAQITSPAEVDTNLFAQNIEVREFPPAPKVVGSLSVPQASVVMDETVSPVSQAEDVAGDSDMSNAIPQEGLRLEKENTISNESKTVVAEKVPMQQSSKKVAEDDAVEQIDAIQYSTTTGAANTALQEVTVAYLDADMEVMEFVAPNPNVRSMASVKDLFSLLYTAP